MNLEAFVLGTGGMMPLPHRFLTSVLLRREGDLFLFDCGEATQISLRKLNLKWKKISAIFISHTHADHVTGLPGILMLSSQVDREEPLYIYGPPKIKEYVETSRKVLDMYINYEIIVKEIYEDGEILRGDGFSVTAFKLEHSKPCIGYTLTEESRPGIFHPEKALALNVPKGPLWSVLQRGDAVKLEDGTVVTPEDVLGEERSGRKFSYVTDTLYLEKIADYVAESDLFICEGMFRHELEEDAADKKHMTSVQAATCAKNAGGVKKMGLIHYSPRYIESDLKKMLKEARDVFPDTFLSRDGMQIDIPNVD
ncbi:MAG: ribonuclease Z [Spirochaetales bacterium]|uniref:Ribonuclease Z n=1 Tax=Candidatus Thalassospirochaeta sargassi TaxID=3119039 RepID=A0AAJ1ML52_9SPIO|nr:ribonuclease Z [Spirochaetales bacterium]